MAEGAAAVQFATLVDRLKRSYHNLLAEIATSAKPSAARYLLATKWHSDNKLLSPTI